jgi:hypothetical protein
MNAKEATKAGIDMGAFVCNTYLEDLTDAQLLERSLPGTNHIAWQLGHLIAAENGMLSAVKPGAMPKLPDGFAEKYTKETAGSDNPADFLTKAEYQKLAKEQRAATYALLDSLSDEDLDQPGPEAMRSYCPTVGSVFTMQGSHWLMHGGQWAIIRRKLGKPPLF